MIVAFDVDDTLWKVRKLDCPVECPHPATDHDHFDQVPDYDLIQVLRWFASNGDTVLVWSAGGTGYAKQIMKKLGLDDLVRVVRKGQPGVSPDLTFDDQEVKLGKVNCKVNRNSHG